MSLPSWPDKDPNEVLDYTIDWTSRLIGSDTVSSVVWTVPSGITKDSQSNDTTKAVIWLSGGSNTRTYPITCQVTTASGRVMEQSVTLKLAEK